MITAVAVSLLICYRANAPIGENILVRVFLTFTILMGLIACGRQNGREFEYETRVNKLPSISLVEELQTNSFGVAALSDHRPILAIALRLIEYFEGWSPVPYDDAAGYCTVGYGHLLALKSCSNIKPPTDLMLSPLSIETGAQILDKDTSFARMSVQQLVTHDLNDNQFSALVSFVFNIGHRNFSQSTLLRLINEGNVDAAANEFPRWVLAKGKKLSGLERRRFCERALFAGELISADFSVQSCESLGISDQVIGLIDIELGEMNTGGEN